MARPSSSSRSKEQKPAESVTIPAGFALEGKLEFKPPEDMEERRHRLRKDAWSFWVKEASVYLVALLVLLMTTAYCFWVLLRPGAAKEERQWVMSVLTSLIVGIVGYVFGKSIK
jgi:hypothetical protein